MAQPQRDWEFAETDDAGDASWLSGRPYPDKIVVPFCRESKLSGLARTGFIEKRLVPPHFPKTGNLEIPTPAAARRRVRLEDACLGERQSGGGTRWLQRFVLLRRDAARQAGRQYRDHSRVRRYPQRAPGPGEAGASLQSEGCMYTRTTGIWQTVWLEGVGQTFLRDVRIEPDAKHSRVILEAQTDGPSDGLVLKAVARAGDRKSARRKRPPTGAITGWC